MDRFRKLAGCKGALKRGADGPVAINDDAKSDTDFPATDRVVDTTAAGDSFSGGFLGSYLQHASVSKAMTQWHHFASTVIGHHGAIVPRSNWIRSFDWASKTAD